MSPSCFVSSWLLLEVRCFIAVRCDYWGLTNPLVRIPPKEVVRTILPLEDWITPGLATWRVYLAPIVVFLFRVSSYLTIYLPLLFMLYKPVVTTTFAACSSESPSAYFVVALMTLLFWGATNAGFFYVREFFFCSFSWHAGHVNGKLSMSGIVVYNYWKTTILTMSRPTHLSWYHSSHLSQPIMLVSSVVLHKQ